MPLSEMPIVRLSNGLLVGNLYLRGLIPRAKGDSISSVLTTEFVLKIIELRSQGLGSKRIAKALNLPWRAVEKVISGRTWNHITGLEKPSDLVDGAPASTIKTRRRRAVRKLEAAS